NGDRLMLLPTDFLIAGGFYTFAIISIVGALGIVLSRKVFHNALFLTVVLGAVAGAYVVLGADFLAVVQILVYVGAIMVLVIFGIMLPPQTVDLPDIAGRPQAIAGTIVSIAVFIASAGVLATGMWPRLTATPIDVPTTQTIGVGLLTTYG